MTPHDDLSEKYCNPNREKRMHESPYGETFLLYFEDGTFATATGHQVSRLLDLADCYDPHDAGIKDILATGRDGTIQKVRAGEQRKVSTDQEAQVVFAISDLLTEDGTVVGTVEWTDH